MNYSQKTITSVSEENKSFTFGKGAFKSLNQTSDVFQTPRQSLGDEDNKNKDTPNFKMNAEKNEKFTETEIKIISREEIIKTLEQSREEQEKGSNSIISQVQLVFSAKDCATYCYSLLTNFKHQFFTLSEVRENLRSFIHYNIRKPETVFLTVNNWDLKTKNNMLEDEIIVGVKDPQNVDTINYTLVVWDYYHSFARNELSRLFLFLNESSKIEYASKRMLKHIIFCLRVSNRARHLISLYRTKVQDEKIKIGEKWKKAFMEKSSKVSDLQSSLEEFLVSSEITDRVATMKAILYPDALREEKNNQDLIIEECANGYFELIKEENL